MKIYHGGPRYKEDERMHWLSKKRYKIGLIIPTLVVYMVFIIIPIGMSIGYSFTKYSGIGKATFNGLTNYMRLFKDRLFWISLKNTMIMFILAFVLLLSLSFLIALLLNNKLKGVDFSKSLIFSPAIIAPIIVGIIWVYILDPKKTEILFDLRKAEAYFDRNNSDGWSKGVARCPLNLMGKEHLDIHIYSDKISLEIFSNDYQNNFSCNIYNVDDDQKNEMTAIGGDLMIESIRSWELEKTMK